MSLNPLLGKASTFQSGTNQEIRNNLRYSVRNRGHLRKECITQLMEEVRSQIEAREVTQRLTRVGGYYRL